MKKALWRLRVYIVFILNKRYHYVLLVDKRSLVCVHYLYSPDVGNVNSAKKSVAVRGILTGTGQGVPYRAGSG